MPPVAYESAAETLVELSEENDKSHISFKKSINPPSSDTPVFNKHTTSLQSNDVYVLDSTKSGPQLRTWQDSFYGRILKPVFDDLLKLKHTYVATSSSTSIHEFGSTLVSKDRPILVIIIAGDTSVGEFVNSLSSSSSGDIKVFVVPAGTGNSLSLSLGINDELSAIKRLLLHTNDDFSPFQIYQASFPENSYILENSGQHLSVPNPVFFVVVASWAFHASLVADSDTEEMRKHGIDRFKVAAHENLSRKQEYNGQLKIDEGTARELSHNGPFAYLVVTPSQRFEPAFNISPKGNIYDSNLYVISFKSEEDDSYIIDIMKQVYDNGSHVSDSKVSYDRVGEESAITLTLGRNEGLETRRFCIDGAIVVVPETENTSVVIQHHGSKVHGWNLTIGH